MTEKSDLYFGGVPVAPDVKKLTKRWPTSELSVDTVISYEEIAKEINEDVRSSRFRTVTSKWRKEVEEESDKIIAPHPDRIPFTFKVLSENEKANHAASKLKTSGRMAKRSFMIVSRTDREKLSEENKNRYDHIEMNARKIMSINQVRGPRQLPII